MVDLTDDIALALASVQPLATEKLRGTPRKHHQIEAVLGLLESALEKCRERQDQLTPLIEALDIINAREGRR